MVHQLISLDGDRNEMPVCLVGLSPCVVPKKKIQFNMLNSKKNFLLLGIKFRDHAKEEVKQQPATLMDFLTRKKNIR